MLFILNDWWVQFEGPHCQRVPVLLLTTGLAVGITAKAVIADMEPETFELMLGWMYGTIDMEISLFQASDLYVASDKLGMTLLNDACAQIIALELPGFTAWDLIDEIEELWEFATAIQSTIVTDVSMVLCHLCASMSASWQMTVEACSMTGVCLETQQKVLVLSSVQQPAKDSHAW